MPNDTETKPTNTAAEAPASPAERRSADPLTDVLSRVPPAVAAEYEAARSELALLGAAVTAIAGSSEAEALTYARAVRNDVARIAVRWARARKALNDAAQLLAPRSGQLGDRHLG